MYSFASWPPPQNLAEARPGERVRIRKVHVSANREHCAELGIREGEDLLCLRQTPAQVVVQFPECHTAALERGRARFVELVADGTGG